MKTKKVNSGSQFEEKIGYSRAVLKNNIVYVSGTTGYDYKTQTISNDVVDQADKCFQNINYALSECGASFNDIVRVTYIMRDKNDFEKCWSVFKKYLSEAMPAATMIQAELADDQMKIEIEVTADIN